MTFIVETFIYPNKLVNPNSFTQIVDIDYYQLITDLTDAFSDSYTLNNRIQLKRTVNTYVLNLFDAYNKLAADSVRLTDNLTNIRTQLDTLKINNVSLKDELAHMYEMSEGSIELINDYKQLYNINYTKNWGIFMSIIFSCYVMSIMFKSKPITL